MHVGRVFVEGYLIEILGEEIDDLVVSGAIQMPEVLDSRPSKFVGHD